MKKQIDFKEGSVQTIENGLVCNSWEISPELFYFEGHFPHLPVLPAVAIIDVCLAFLQAGHPHKKADSFQLLQVKSAKFLQPLSPGLTMQIKAMLKNPGEWELDWLDASTLDVAAQLRLCVSV